MDQTRALPSRRTLWFIFVQLLVIVFLIDESADVHNGVFFFWVAKQDMPWILLFIDGWLLAMAPTFMFAIVENAASSTDTKAVKAKSKSGDIDASSWAIVAWFFSTQAWKTITLFSRIASLWMIAKTVDRRAVHGLNLLLGLLAGLVPSSKTTMGDYACYAVPSTYFWLRCMASHALGKHLLLESAGTAGLVYIFRFSSNPKDIVWCISSIMAGLVAMASSLLVDTSQLSEWYTAIVIAILTCIVGFLLNQQQQSPSQSFHSTSLRVYNSSKPTLL